MSARCWSRRPRRRARRARDGGARADNPIPVIGIGEQNPAMFANPYFRQLASSTCG